MNYLFVRGCSIFYKVKILFKEKKNKYKRSKRKKQDNNKRKKNDK